VIGLTGGVASGKSTVAAMLRDVGAEVVDADRIAREIVEPGQPALREIVEFFGSEVLGPDGRLDRKRLANRVFADASARRRLEQITHPRITAESERRFEALRARGVGIAIYEAALLVETGRHQKLDGLIVVVASEAEQLRRLMAREGIDAEEARRRLAAQLPTEAKVALADHVIRCDGPPDQVRPQVTELWRTLIASAAGT